MAESTSLPEAYRLAEGEERGPYAVSQPRCVFIEVTNRCNLRCATCVRTYYSQEQATDLSLTAFRRLVVQFPELERAVLHGIGEPLLNPHLPQMVAELKARGVHVLFNSNGSLLDRDHGRALIESGLDEYRLSLDAADRDTFTRICGRDLFEQVVANMRAFVALKRELGASYPSLSLWCIGMKGTLHELPSLIRLAAEIDIPEVYLQRLTYLAAPAGRRGMAQAEQALFGAAGAREDAILDECEQLSQALGLAFRASGATDPQRSVAAARDVAEMPWRACRRPWTTAYITANGNALPCCIAPFAASDYAGLIMGKVWDTSFADIWNGERYRAWRERLLSSDPPEACSGCGVYWSL
ncbi:MAG: radical SAM protein [Anaerolineae bacterium]|nr:radical SAM protein [Anaerolineae bacterium]